VDYWNKLEPCAGGWRTGGLGTLFVRDVNPSSEPTARLWSVTVLVAVFTVRPFSRVGHDICDAAKLRLLWPLVQVGELVKWTKATRLRQTAYGIRTCKGISWRKMKSCRTLVRRGIEP
jgi:hypothetical protein